MAATGLYLDGDVYTSSEHRQLPAISPRNGYVTVHIRMVENIQPYRLLSGSSSTWSPVVFFYPECLDEVYEVLFGVPFNELLRLHEMPPDSVTLITVNQAMERLGNPHPDVERTILRLIQRECNAIVGEQPVGPVSSVISIYADVITPVLVPDEEDVEDERAILEESFEEASGLVIKAAREEAIKKLERFVVREDDEDEDRATCTVCMDEMEAGDRGVRMPCDHVYHEDCIVEWLGVSCSCPICRFQLVSEIDGI